MELKITHNAPFSLEAQKYNAIDIVGYEYFSINGHEYGYCQFCGRELVEIIGDVDWKMLCCDNFTCILKKILKEQGYDSNGQKINK